MDPLLVLAIGIGVVLSGVLWLRLPPFLALIAAAAAVSLLTDDDQLATYAQSQVAKGGWTVKTAEGFVDSTVMDRVASAFGDTCGKIGILIAMAAVVGKCLLDSGAAERIVRQIVRGLGEARAAVGFLFSGFFLGIPVFFDTVFYLMIPLGKAMRLRTGGNYLLYVLAIMAGATMAHSLVPPTPGPLIVAAEFDVNLGLMIMVGCAVGVIAATAGYLFATLLNRWIEIPLRDTADTSVADLHAIVERNDADLPPLWLAALPIALPVFLISFDTIFTTTVDAAAAPAALSAVVHSLGNKNAALTLSAAISMLMVAYYRRTDRQQFATAIQGALASGGIIILITSSGGAFGAAVRQCGVAARIESLTSEAPSLWLLPLAFGVTTVMRTAQGSATVAMITSAGILQNLAQSQGLGFHPVYLAAAIGCGSKPIAWMNDSGFWVICRMSGMTDSEGLRTVTPMSVVMGVAGLCATMLLANLLPLI